MTLAIGLAQVLLLLASTGRMHDLAQRHLATQAETQAYLVEALAGINVVKATGAEELVLRPLELGCTAAHWPSLWTSSGWQRSLTRCSTGCRRRRR